MSSKWHLLRVASIGLLHIAGVVSIVRAQTTEAPTQDENPGKAPTSAIVWLDADSPTTDHPVFFDQLLMRELVRQAVLITARDELGLFTRDAVLRDAMPADRSDDSQRLLRITTHATADKVLQITISRGEKQLWNKELALTTEPFEYYVPVVQAMEAASRAELVDALKQAGFEGSVPAPADHPPSAETETSLVGSSFAAQFTAVRDAHAQIRATGQSPQLLGVLARGYAHLGYMTQHYWTSMCKAFQARALLYAERLVATQPGKAFPLWVRGYARAWVGLHAAALADIAEADKLAKTTSEARPEWASLAERHCHYDFDGLTKLADEQGQWSALARLLAFMDLAQGGGNASSIEAGQRALAALPDAYLVYDRICEFGGIGLGHSATVQGSMALSTRLPQELAALRDLPEEITRQLPSASAPKSLFGLFGVGRPDEGFSNRPSQMANAFIDYVRSGGDASEPSWAVLGRMIQEEDFSSSARRCLFLKEALGVPVDDFVAAVMPNLSGHPYAGWMESTAINKDKEPKKYQDALRRVPMRDLYWRAWRFAQSAYGVPLANHETGAEVLRRLHHGMDLIAPDMEGKLAWVQGGRDEMREFAQSLLTISPHSPRFVVTLIDHSDVDDAQFKDWETNDGRHVSVLRALARRYVAAKQFENAERCLRRALELSPDPDAIEVLADVYKQQGDEEKWLATLEEALSLPDYGLQHAVVQTRIARYYMEHRQYAKARPYAEQAAQMWAGWGMDIASECLEALHEWDASEEWVRNLATRYDGQQLLWYFWCRRTGHGDTATAIQLAQELVDELNAQSPPARQDRVGIFYLLAGERRKAYDAFRAEYNKSHSYWSGLHLVLLADEFGDDATRDDVLNFFVQYGVPDRSASMYGLAKLAVLLHDAYSTDDGDLDLSAVDDALAASIENVRMDASYFAARYLALRGRTEDSERYLEKCYASTDVTQLNRTLAGADLIDAGRDPEQLKGPNDSE